MANRRNYDEYVADIHFVYGFCNGNASAAVREYRRRFPNRPTPSYHTFIDIHARLANYGIRRPAPERVRDLPVAAEEDVLDLIHRDPRLSLRRLSRMTGLGYWTISKILHREGLHPFHFRRAQKITGQENYARCVFSSWINLRVRRNPDFLTKIMWTDEAKFTRRGITNFRNQHLWMAENPHAVRTSTFQHEFSINVWAAMIDDILTGPIELPERLNGPRFLHFLQNEFNS